jgi:Protein of unknown function (DUF3313)
MKFRVARWLVIIGVFASVFVVSGCAATLRARGVDESGFLGADYALLKPGGEEQAQRVYRRPDVDWAKYRNVLLDPVTVWKGKESTGQGISAQDEQVLVNYFYSVIRGALEKQGFSMVSSPQANTLRVQVAITKAEESDVALNVISTVIPTLHAVSSLDQLATGKPAFVGEGQIEVKVTDSLTGQLLAAGIDHRVGGKSLDASMMTSWGAVESMMRLWANHGSYNLCRLQRRTDCVLPPDPQAN